MLNTLMLDFQKLEPIDLPQVITSERLLSHQETWTRHKVKQELEKKMQTPTYTSGKRQYLHKMQMLEMNRKRQEAQMKLKQSLHGEEGTYKQQPRDRKAKKILQSIPGNEDNDPLTMLPEKTMNRGPGNSQTAEFLEYQAGNNYRHRKIGKMEAWLCEQEARGQLLWDSSSMDSDEQGDDEKKSRALVRTRTERIPLFDEFFDRE